ncbi:hypothetical protein TIFTF001_046545 [Ficus carica]|uniref:Rhamnogalacturonase A/B/Epimerase-like pectate lyase domain-containing protein n=1 Tax=Ficus carica TaxID=3494 RepID=A0AA88CVU4_FICCA|nr:hypothetical protein TIFTF001_046545 [Ficus carica]
MAILPCRVVALIPLMIIFVTLMSHAALSSAAAATYNVVSLGAKADGKTDSTKAFLAAWAKACASPKPAVVFVPQGRFFLKNVVFGGECNNKAVTFRIAGTLVAPSDYRVFGDAGNWIFFEHVNGVTISGGILDAQGTSLWACKTSGKSCPSGATCQQE